MSFQPMPGTSQVIEPTSRSNKRKRFLLLGLASLVVGLVAALGLTIASRNQYADAVGKLQRAPVGCDTEFDFTQTGVFILYLETQGHIGSIRGDCVAAESAYSRTDANRPRVSLLLAAESLDKIGLDRTKAASYIADGFVGQAFREVTIDKPGIYTLSVESAETDFAIAIGRNPRNDTQGLKKLGLALGLGGLLLGALLALVGLRSASGTKTPPVVVNNYGYSPSSPSQPPAPPTSTFGPGFVPGPTGTGSDGTGASGVVPSFGPPVQPAPPIQAPSPSWAPPPAPVQPASPVATSPTATPPTATPPTATPPTATPPTATPIASPWAPPSPAAPAPSDDRATEYTWRTPE